MRKFDKKLNIVKANLLSEQRYLENKDGLSEGWRTNVAAGLASLGGAAGAQAQQAPQQAPQQQTIQHQQAPTQDDGKTSNAFNAPRTLPIVAIQTGVQDGKTGKSGVYVYHKLPSDPSFDVNTDREIVYNENLPNLRKTVEYQDYMRQKQGGQQAQGQAVAGINESEKKK